MKDMDILSRFSERGNTKILLVRHAERDALPEAGGTGLLTPHGVETAFNLGKDLSQGIHITYAHSPVTRCRQTVDAIAAGRQSLGISTPPSFSCLPGLALWERPGLKGIRLSQTLPKASQKARLKLWATGGMEGPNLDIVAREIIGELEQEAVRAPDHRLLAVAHDWTVAAIAESLRPESVSGARGWIDPLDGLLLTHDEQNARTMHFRGTATPYNQKEDQS